MKLSENLTAEKNRATFWRDLSKQRVRFWANFARRSENRQFPHAQKKVIKNEPLRGRWTERHRSRCGSFFWKNAQSRPAKSQKAPAKINLREILSGIFHFLAQNVLTKKRLCQGSCFRNARGRTRIYQNARERRDRDRFFGRRRHFFRAGNFVARRRAHGRDPPDRRNKIKPP